MRTIGTMEAGAIRLMHCQYFKPITLTHTHIHTHTHTHTHLHFQLHNADFTDTDKQCEGSYHSTEHSDIEEEEEDDKEIGEDKKTACVSSESQARGAHVLFQGSVWGEKGDLGRLCLSVLHVLCILSFVMISASAEGGMLASRVQERGGLMGGGGLGCSSVKFLQPLEWSLSSLPRPRVGIFSLYTHAKPLFLPSLNTRASCCCCSPEQDIYTVSRSSCASLSLSLSLSLSRTHTHTHTHTHTAITILPALDGHASHRSSTHSRYCNREIQQSLSLLQRCYLTNSLVCYKTDIVHLLQKQN